jgi:hypothetical protein
MFLLKRPLNMNIMIEVLQLGGLYITNDAFDKR